VAIHEGNLRRIPHFISAASPKALQRSMFLNNVKDGYEYRYFDISEDKKGKWIAWYYKIMTIEVSSLLPKGGE
jgi:hypothetical protein